MMNRVENPRYTVNPDAAASIHDDGIVILHIGKGRLFTSNGTGARIWRGLQRRLRVESIAEEISGEYQIDQSTAREHTLHFLGALERQALVSRGIAA